MAIVLKHIYLIKSLYSVVHPCCWLSRHLHHLRNLKNTFLCEVTQIISKKSNYSGVNILFVLGILTCGWAPRVIWILQCWLLLKRLTQTITWFHYFSLNFCEDSYKKFETTIYVTFYPWTQFVLYIMPLILKRLTERHMWKEKQKQRTNTLSN